MMRFECLGCGTLCEAEKRDVGATIVCRQCRCNLTVPPPEAAPIPFGINADWLRVSQEWVLAVILVAFLTIGVYVFYRFWLWFAR
jgi:hypothetical protein